MAAAFVVLVAALVGVAVEYRVATRFLGRRSTVVSPSPVEPPADPAVSVFPPRPPGEAATPEPEPDVSEAVSSLDDLYAEYGDAA